ncbi:MAG: hypothetical protein ACKPCM_20010 [Pseudanabaena sp.]
MTRNIQDYIDRGYSYEELLSQGLAEYSDLESYESAYSLPPQTEQPKIRKKVKKSKQQADPIDF